MNSEFDLLIGEESKESYQSKFLTMSSSVLNICFYWKDSIRAFDHSEY